MPPQSSDNNNGTNNKLPKRAVPPPPAQSQSASSSAKRPAPPPPVGKSNSDVVRQLISANKNQSQRPNDTAFFVNINDLHPNPDQPRKDTTPQQDAELAEDIGRRGILQPIIVRPHPDSEQLEESPTPQYQIVAGERRYHAARTAQLRVVPVIIQELSDEDAETVSLVENLQRADLFPLDEARYFQRLIDTENESTRSIARRINKSQSYVQQRLDLLKPHDTVPDSQALTALSAEDSAATGTKEREKSNKRIKNTQLLPFSQFERSLNRLSTTLAESDTAFSALKVPEKQKLVQQIGNLREQLAELEKKLTD